MKLTLKCVCFCDSVIAPKYMMQSQNHENTLTCCTRSSEGTSCLVRTERAGEDVPSDEVECAFGRAGKCLWVERVP